MFQELTHKLYAASISIDPAGAMLVSSTHDRFMAWATVFCFIAASCLIIYLIWRKPLARKCSLGLFIFSFIIPAYVIPIARSEYIKVSETEMIIESSNWLVNARTTVDLKDLQSLRETQIGMMPGNLLGDPRVEWHFAWHNGQKQSLALNDFFNAHRFVVAHYIRERGNRVFWLDKPVDTSFIKP